MDRLLSIEVICEANATRIPRRIEALRNSVALAAWTSAEPVAKLRGRLLLGNASCALFHH
jgi:hypothetical protein